MFRRGFGAVLFAWRVGIGALVGGQSRIECEFPPSVRHSPATFPQGGRLLAFAYALWGGSKETAFLGAPALQSLGWCGLFLLPYICVHTKNPTSIRGGIFDIGFQYLHTAIHL